MSQPTLVPLNASDCVQRKTGAQHNVFAHLAVRAALQRSLLPSVFIREAYSDDLELTEAIYELCHHISDPGVLKLHVPHPLESLIWPPVIPHPPRFNPPRLCGLLRYAGALMWPLVVNWRIPAQLN